MIDQIQLPLPNLPEPGRHHGRRAQDTERAAAKAIAPHTGSQRWRILELLRDSGPYGATDWEITNALGMLRSSACARRNELVREGWAKDSGRRREERPTGATAIVWVLSEAGRAEMGAAR